MANDSVAQANLLELLLACTDHDYGAIATTVALAGEQRQQAKEAARVVIRDARIAEIEAVIGNHYCDHRGYDVDNGGCPKCHHNVYNEDYGKDVYLEDLEKLLVWHNLKTYIERREQARGWQTPPWMQEMLAGRHFSRPFSSDLEQLEGYVERLNHAGLQIPAGDAEEAAKVAGYFAKLIVL